MKPPRHCEQSFPVIASEARQSLSRHSRLPRHSVPRSDYLSSLQAKPPRHCERSAAISLATPDCHVTPFLAVTAFRHCEQSFPVIARRQSRRGNLTPSVIARRRSRRGNLKARQSILKQTLSVIASEASPSLRAKRGNPTLHKKRP